MAKPDYAHKMTDAELSKLEQRIAKLYKEAADELTDTVKDYFEQFEKRDAAMKKKLDAGEITEQAYKQWRLAQIGRGKRFEALRDKVAERYTNAHEVAIDYINDATPGIYTLNRNYSAYTIEQISDKADFTLWDEQTVRRLIEEQPGLMPYYPPKRALKRGIDLDYGKKQITASITSSILQGKGIDKISSDLQSRMQGMSLASAIRTARTATTAAQNAGRMDSYHAAEGMGIKLKKEWLATLDGRTRHAHAMLDGQTAETDKPFHVDGYEIMYPGDTSAPGYLVYNCRCTLIAALDGVDTSSGGRRARDPKTSEWVTVSNTTYAKWANWKTETRSTLSDDDAPVKTWQVYGRGERQKYSTSTNDTVMIYATGREKRDDGTWTDIKRLELGTEEIPTNEDKNLLVVTGLPDKTTFGQFDDTPNYILADGRMALNKTAKNENTRVQISAAVENEIYALCGMRQEGHFYRVIGSEKEIGYIKKGTVRKSVNHLTGEAEDGLSVWEVPKYGGGKLVEVTGEVISTGSDGEPVLDISTIKFVRVVDDAVELRKKGIEAFKKKYKWTDAQIEQALRGGYKLNR